MIPDGFLVTTTPIANGSPIKFTVVSGQNKVILAGSKTVDGVIVECSEYGLVGNVGDGEINLVAQAGIDRVTNSRIYSKGADAESDADYRERIWDKRRRPEKAGTPADWEGWAKEVSGVKRATCFRAARGPGTVDIMILGPDGSFPGQGLLDRSKKLSGRKIFAGGYEDRRFSRSGARESFCRNSFNRRCIFRWI